MKKFLCLLMSALLMFGMLAVVASAADNVVFVDYVTGADTNDGLSASAPKKSIDNKNTGAMQYTKAAGGTIVVSGKLYIGNDYTINTKNGGAITITASMDGIDYRNPTPANNPASGVLKTAKGKNLTIATDVTLTDLILFHEYDAAPSTIIVTNGATLTITDTVTCMSKGAQYYSIVVEEGSSAVINGGVYSSISGEGNITTADNVIINSGYQEAEAPGYGFVDYAAGSDGNDGLTATTAKKLFGTASGKGLISLVKKGGTAVVSGKAYIGADYTLADVGAPITFTSYYNGVDYKNAEPATNPACAFKIAKAKTITLENDVIFDNIILFEEYDTNTIVVKSGKTLTFTDTVVFMSKNGTHWTIELESGANLVLPESAKSVLTINNNGGTVSTYTATAAPTTTVVKLTIGQTTGYINGAAKTLDAAPIIRESRTMLPVRFVAEAFGATVGWDGATSTATVKTADTTIEITIGATTAKVNGQTVTLDAPAFIENSRTYLPVRFVAENLGASVAWDGATSTATLTK